MNSQPTLGKFLEEVVEERKAVYGDYREGAIVRASIMLYLKRLHNEVNGTEIDPIHEIYLLDIVNKLCRVAASPTHEDSWLDIGGYAQRILEAVKYEVANEKKQ